MSDTRVSVETCPAWCTVDHADEVAWQLDPEWVDPTARHAHDRAVGAVQPRDPAGSAFDVTVSLQQIDDTPPGVWIECSGEVFTADGARELVALLIAAAALLDGAA